MPRPANPFLAHVSTDHAPTKTSGEPFIIAHEIGHWIQQQIVGEELTGSDFSYDYGPDDGEGFDPFADPDQNPDTNNDPYKEACWFAIEGPVSYSNSNPNRHGIRSAEFSSGAMIEGFAHFVASTAFSDLEEEGRFRYYKNVDQVRLIDYEDFETEGSDFRQVELAGGGAGTVGGRSRWTALECAGEAPNDWDYPLQAETLGQEVSTEIDWLRLFWQYVTAPYAGSDPASAPGFWDAVDLVTESQSASPSWTLTIVWPRMDDAIDAFLSGNDWVQRWRDLSANTSGGNGVYNGDTDP